jgi:signal transduction histidine kinase
LTLVAGVAIQAWLTFGSHGGTSIQPRDTLAITVAILLAASLAWRRRAPLLVLAMAIAAASVTVTEPIDAPLAVVVALTIATYSVGANTTGRAAVLGGIGVAVLVAIAVVKDLGADSEINDVAVPVLILGTPWLAGLSLRSRREREVALEGLRVEHANAAVADERARIARDLHDAVAHSMGVIILQARGARRTFQSDPDAAMEALDAIERTGAAALAEMRGLVGVLRDDGQRMALAPPPSLRHVGSLVATVREAGLPVDLLIEGTPVGLPAGMDASAYRIVQEALTNALAHAGPATANVVIRYGPDDLDLEIGDTGVGPRDVEVDGHGLTGMRQRVSFHDGRLEVGPRPGGGFMVRASLPLRAPTT